MEISNRYSRLNEKRRSEEVVLLQGKGCFWKKCRFCDYYRDTGKLSDVIDLNSKVLKNVTGETGWLTVINSGSFFELPEETIMEIEDILLDKAISDLTLEAHYRYRDLAEAYKERLKNKGIRVHPRIGIETFDSKYREEVLQKGMGYPDVEEIAEVYDECCLLYGLPHQSKETLLGDIRTALNNFSDVYLNIYEERNNYKADKNLIKEFCEKILPEIKDNPKLHILLNNTDLGVG